MNSGPVAQFRPTESKLSVRDGGVERVGRLAGEHGTHRFNGARDHGRNRIIRARGPAGRWPASPALTLRVSWQVSSSRISAPPSTNAFGLVVIVVDQIRERDAAGDGDGFGRGSHGTRHKARTAGVREFVRRLARKLGGGEVQLVGAILQAHTRPARSCVLPKLLVSTMSEPAS